VAGDVGPDGIGADELDATDLDPDGRDPDGLEPDGLEPGEIGAPEIDAGAREADAARAVSAPKSPSVDACSSMNVLPRDLDGLEQENARVQARFSRRCAHRGMRAPLPGHTAASVP
jgi:hypothetical protein